MKPIWPANSEPRRSPSTSSMAALRLSVPLNPLSPKWKTSTQSHASGLRRPTQRPGKAQLTTSPYASSHVLMSSGAQPGDWEAGRLAGMIPALPWMLMRVRRSENSRCRAAACFGLATVGGWHIPLPLNNLHHIDFLVPVQPPFKTWSLTRVCSFGETREMSASGLPFVFHATALLSSDPPLCRSRHRGARQIHWFHSIHYSFRHPFSAQQAHVEHQNIPGYSGIRYGRCDHPVLWKHMIFLMKSTCEDFVWVWHPIHKIR